jgi:uncharacterized protein
MRIIIPGGSGQVGTVLARAFVGDGHDVTVLSRQAVHLNDRWRVVSWDARTAGNWINELEGADVIINLAGRSVNCRYTSANRKAIMDSRIDSTRIIGQAIAQCTTPPRIWLQASTATIYAHRFDAPNDERTGTIGGSVPPGHSPDSWKFSIEVATAWERTSIEANTPRTRKVLMRSAMVMSPDTGGIFDTLLRLVRFGLGGTSGNGKQYISWIHELDFVRALYWLIAHEAMNGAVNIASPNPLPNAEFMRELRRAWGKRIGLPANRLMLELGAIFMRTETELVLKSRRVVPTRLLESGFRFEFPHWPQAAAELCERSRLHSKAHASVHHSRANQ